MMFDGENDCCKLFIAALEHVGVAVFHVDNQKTDNQGNAKRLARMDENNDRI